MQENLSLIHLVRQPKKQTSSKPPLALLLHGYGSNEQDLFSFASELPDELIVVSARAPLSHEMGGYAWYTINFDLNNGKFSDTDEAKESIELIKTFIDEIHVAYNTDPQNTFLIGFSQGAILSYGLVLNNPEKAQHVVALSGYVNYDLLPPNLNELNYSNLDIFASHGSVDQVIPVEWAQNTPPLLKELNIPHTYKEYMVGHGVAPQNFYDFKAWIEARI
ncbi:alpha/beta fold hydrolase [Urechidicola sp. KH5]